LDLLKAAWTPNTKVVMPVDLGGWPVDYRGIANWLRSESVTEVFKANNSIQEQLGRPLFLADAAHSFGATLQGSKIGQQADITGFSFHAVKNLTTAEGGALTFALPDAFNLEEIAQWFRTMSLHGQSKSAFEKTRSGSWNYDVVDAGYKCNMTDIQAALGRTQLMKYQEQLQVRKKLAFAYHTAFAYEPWYIAPPLLDEVRESSYHLFTMRIKGFNQEKRDALMEHLKDHGIASNVHFMPLPLLSLHKNRGENISNYPNSQLVFEELISLPLHLQMTMEDIEYVASHCIGFIRSNLQHD
jgi:dTDP-4-amino-4,6-dideoxygalactose transaminase